MSQSLKIWREASAKIDFSWMNSMVREQASIFRRLGELNEFLRPSRELIAQISRAIGIVDWGAISRGLAKALPPNWGLQLATWPHPCNQSLPRSCALRKRRGLLPSRAQAL